MPITTPGSTTITAPSRTIIRDHFTGRRAEAHAHANLAHARRHRIRQQAEQPDRRQRQRQRRRHAGHARDQPLLDDGVVDPHVHGEDRAHEMLMPGRSRRPHNPVAPRPRRPATRRWAIGPCGEQIRHHRPVQRRRRCASRMLADLGVGDDTDNLGVRLRRARDDVQPFANHVTESADELASPRFR